MAHDLRLAEASARADRCQYRSFSAEETSPNRLSSVQSGTLVRKADASRCMSTYPNPFPIRRRSSINCITSPCSAGVATGRAQRRESISDLFLRFPQASSPMINEWQTTEPLFNSAPRPVFPARRCATHTEVSTRTMLCSSCSSPGYLFKLLLSSSQSGKSFTALP